MQKGNSFDMSFRCFAELAMTPGEDHSLQKLNVSFLVTTERLNQTILGFNLVKIFVQRNDNLDLLYEMICQSAGNELSQG